MRNSLSMYLICGWKNDGTRRVPIPGQEGTAGELLEMLAQDRVVLTLYLAALGDAQCYPLVNIQKAIENCHRNSGFSHEKWWFSIAMLVHQRVLCDLLGRVLSWNDEDLVDFHRFFNRFDDIWPPPNDNMFVEVAPSNYTWFHRQKRGEPNHRQSFQKFTITREDVGDFIHVT